VIRKTLQISFLFLILTSLLAGSAHATDYYVSPDGTGDGLTIETPGDPALIDSVALAGDNVYFRGGPYQDKRMAVTHSGTVDNPITFTNYPGEYPILNGSQRTTTDYNGIDIKNVKYINVSNLTFTNYNQGVYVRYDASSTNCAVGIHLYNVTASHTGSSGICLNNFVQYSSIRNCTVEDNGWNSLAIYGTSENKSDPVKYTHDILVENCTTLPPYGHSAIDLYGGMENLTLKNNTIDGGIVFTHPTSGVTVDKLLRFSVLDGNIVKNSYAQGIYVEANDSIFRNNHVYNCSDVAIRTFSYVDNLTLENNIVHDNVGSGIYITGQNVLCIGNTVYNHTTGSTYDYRIQTGGGTIRNPVLPANSVYPHVKIYSGACDSIIEFLSGRVFSTSGATLYGVAGSTYTVSNTAENAVLYSYSAIPAEGTATIVPGTLSGEEVVNFEITIPVEDTIQFDAWDLDPGQYVVKDCGTNLTTQFANEAGSITWDYTGSAAHIFTVEPTGVLEEPEEQNSPQTPAEWFRYLISFRWW
jgi:parallel beta-helix repeat protein